MRKYFIANVNFGTNNSEENKNCFLDINDVTTSSLNVQIAVFGRQFPHRATKDQMIQRINEQLAAMEVWKKNLAALMKQVIFEDFQKNKAVYEELLGKQYQLIDQNKGIFNFDRNSDIPDAIILEEGK